MTVPLKLAPGLLMLGLLLNAPASPGPSESMAALLVAGILLELASRGATGCRVGTGWHALGWACVCPGLGSPWLLGLLLAVSMLAFATRLGRGEPGESRSVEFRRTVECLSRATPLLAAAALWSYLPQSRGLTLGAVLYLMLVLVTSGESSRARSVRRGAEELLWFGVLWWAWSFGIWGLTLGLTGLVVLFSLQEPSDQELRQSLAQQMHVTESTLRVSQQRFQRDTHRFQNLLWQQETLDEFQLRALQTENEGALSQLLLDSVTALERGCQAAIWRLSSESPQQSALVASSPFPLHQFEPLPPECRQGQAVRSVDGGKYYYPLTGELLFVALRQAPQSEKEQQRQELTDHMLGRARLIFRILEQKRQLATLLVEKTRALEQLAESQSQLVQSEKLASIGQLAAGVAHEINSPLAAISLQAQLARRRLAKNDSDGVLRSLETCEQASLKAKAIIENLLAFAQFSDGSRQALRLQEVVEQTMQLLEAHLEQASIETRVRMGPELSPVQANAQEVSQILTNILTNAVDALAARPEGRRIAVGATQNEREQSLTISNNGPLIPAEHLEKLFDPFFTTKEIGQGTGLGLSLAYQLARSNGGNLIVSNGEGWVRFTLTLPLGVAPE